MEIKLYKMEPVSVTATVKEVCSECGEDLCDAGALRAEVFTHHTRSAMLDEQGEDGMDLGVVTGADEATYPVAIACANCGALLAEATPT